MLTCSFCCVFAGKKLKKKLEDLEARAASAPPSPPQLHQELDAAVEAAFALRWAMMADVCMAGMGS